MRTYNNDDLEMLPWYVNVVYDGGIDSSIEIVNGFDKRDAWDRAERTLLQGPDDYICNVWEQR